MIFSIFFIEKHMRFIHNVQTGGMFFHVQIRSDIPIHLVLTCSPKSGQRIFIYFRVFYNNLIRHCLP